MISIIMGSDSDWQTMKAAADICEEFKIKYEKKVVSAHRTPDDMAEYAKNAKKNKIQIIIAGAGGAAHLPGMVASYTTLPVIGVPVKTSSLDGLDSLLSIAQMPKGIPVATVAIGNSTNAALLALRILALNNSELNQKLEEFHSKQAQESRKKNNNI